MPIFRFIRRLVAGKTRIMITKKSAIYGEKLKRLRINLFITQKEMAKKFKVSQQSYSDMEKGKTKFTVKKIQKICKIFKISAEEFITIDSKQTALKIKNRDSHNINVLKKHYELLLLEQEIRIGELEMEIKQLGGSIKKGKKPNSLRVMI